MESRRPFSRTLIVAVILLAALFIGTLVSLTITRNIYKRAEEKKATSQTLPTSKPQEEKRPTLLELPSTFPKDMPLPPRSKVTVSDETADGWTAVLLTPQSVNDAILFFQKELKNAGFKITNQSQAGGVTILYVRKDKREAIIAIGRSEEGTTVSLTILKGS